MRQIQPCFAHARAATVLLFLALTTLWGCGSKTTPPSAVPAAPAALVDVVTVHTERLLESVDAVGTLEANENALIKPEIAGRIVRIAFEEGQTVKKDDVLVELDPGKMKQDVEVAAAKHLTIRQSILEQRGQLAAARARISQAQAAMENSRRNVQELTARLSRADAVLDRAKQDESRTRALYEKEFKTVDELEKSVSALKQAEADRAQVLASLAGVTSDLSGIDRHPMVREAQAGMESARASERALLAALGEAADEREPVDVHPEVRRAMAELNLAKERLKDLTLIAPMDGILSRRHVAVGDYTDKGTLMFELVDISTIKTAFNVPERYLGQIRIGRSAEVRVAPYPGDVFRGVIYYIDPKVDETSRTVRMKMRIPNSGHRLKPGLFANVQIVVGEYPNAVVVPEESIVPQGGEFFVFVVENEKASMRPIKIGLRHAGQVQILAGIHAGEQVVVAGLQKIRDGMPVRILPRTGQGGTGA